MRFNFRGEIKGTGVNNKDSGPLYFVNCRRDRDNAGGQHAWTVAATTHAKAWQDTSATAIKTDANAIASAAKVGVLQVGAADVAWMRATAATAATFWIDQAGAEVTVMQAFAASHVAALAQYLAYRSEARLEWTHVVAEKYLAKMNSLADAASDLIVSLASTEYAHAGTLATIGADATHAVATQAASYQASTAGAVKQYSHDVAGATVAYQTSLAAAEYDIAIAREKEKNHPTLLAAAEARYRTALADAARTFANAEVGSAAVQKRAVADADLALAIGATGELLGKQLLLYAADKTQDPGLNNLPKWFG